MSLQEEVDTFNALEKQFSQLQKDLAKLKAKEFDHDEALAAATLDNTKLKCRLNILKRATEEIKLKNPDLQVHIAGDKMISISNHLSSVFTDAVKTTYTEVSDVPIVIAVSSNSKFGDYQFNSSMAIAHKLKALGKPSAPRDVATEIMKNIKNDDLIDRLEIAGPGYINVFIKKSYATGALKSVLLNGVPPPQHDRKRVIVDFSSPNIAKEMHVGHLRSTIIGDAISRLLEFCGHDVLRLNHIGDWGTQFGMLIAHLQDKFPSYRTEKPPLNDLQTFYKDSKVRFDNDEEFKKRAYKCVVELQGGNPEYRQAWDIICSVSRTEFQKIYDRLGVTIIERGESFYQPYMEILIKELNDGGYLEEDEGRKIMWGMTKTGIPLTMEKSGGGFTYDTSDMAAIRQRTVDEKADWIIYVTDAGQSTHFKAIFSCAQRVGYLNLAKHRIDHVGFGLVLGEDGKKFKSRSGDTVKLIELLDEGVKRSEAKLIEKGRRDVLTSEEFNAAKEAVAYGCIKYADLSHNRNSDYVFSFDKMLEDRGNTAVYMLYSYTRIKSIARNCGEDYMDKLKKIAVEKPMQFEHDKEWQLAKVLLKFPDVINEVCRDLFLHRLCEFVYEISTSFSEFYDNCYCIERNKEGKIVKINDERIQLAETTAIVLETCLKILGLKTILKI